MSAFDYDAFDRATLRHDPCDFIVVPRFVRAERLDDINRDYPDIREPGNFPPEELAYGPHFAELLEELHGPLFKQRFSEKFGVDLTGYPRQLTIRKYSEASDGNVHNDSKLKVITALIYFNAEWRHAGGRLRMVRDPRNIDDYAAEVAPEGGTLLAFRRSETSYHGFLPCEAERRSLQMYFVRPKRLKPGETKHVGLKTCVKRLLKVRKR
jgi:Rps23 Pro-64 3,4-dihydroxylase Tpa1-like proline 4-hydroxylase